MSQAAKEAEDTELDFKARSQREQREQQQEQQEQEQQKEHEAQARQAAADTQQSQQVGRQLMYMHVCLMHSVHLDSTSI